MSSPPPPSTLTVQATVTFGPDGRVVETSLLLPHGPDLTPEHLRVAGVAMAVRCRRAMAELQAG